VRTAARTPVAETKETGNGSGEGGNSENGDDKFGVGTAVALGVGGIVGGGIYAAIGIVVAAAGILTWFAYSLATIVVVCCAYSYIKLKRRDRQQRRLGLVHRGTDGEVDGRRRRRLDARRRLHRDDVDVRLRLRHVRPDADRLRVRLGAPDSAVPLGRRARDFRRDQPPRRGLVGGGRTLSRLRPGGDHRRVRPDRTLVRRGELPASARLRGTRAQSHPRRLGRVRLVRRLATAVFYDQEQFDDPDDALAKGVCSSRYPSRQLSTSSSDS